MLCLYSTDLYGHTAQGEVHQCSGKEAALATRNSHNDQHSVRDAICIAPRFNSGSSNERPETEQPKFDRCILGDKSGTTKQKSCTIIGYSLI